MVKETVISFVAVGNVPSFIKVKHPGNNCSSHCSLSGVMAVLLHNMEYRPPISKPPPLIEMAASDPTFPLFVCCPLTVEEQAPPDQPSARTAPGNRESVIREIRAT